MKRLNLADLIGFSILFRIPFFRIRAVYLQDKERDFHILCDRLTMEQNNLHIIVYYYQV
jgi:hypothetical protein